MTIYNCALIKYTKLSLIFMFLVGRKRVCQNTFPSSDQIQCFCSVGTFFMAVCNQASRMKADLSKSDLGRFQSRS